MRFSVGRAMRRGQLVALVVTVLALAFIAVAHGGDALDEVQLLFRSWIEGKQLMIIKLRVHVPQVDADKCFVAIHRFPTSINPTKDGYTERVYAGFVAPGATVVASKLLSAVPAKLAYDESIGAYRVAYYDPQEFMVIVHCVGNGKTTYKWARIVEVFPSKPVYVVDVRPPREAQAEPEVLAVNGKPVRSVEPTLISRPKFECKIIPTTVTGDRGYCYTYVAGPNLYSVEGISTAFGLLGGPRPSAVYIEAFSDSAVCPLGYCDYDVPIWSSSGRKLAPSVITGTTLPLTGNSYVRLYFRVKYVYEEWEFWDSGLTGMMVKYWFLYPSRVTDVVRADTLGVGVVATYEPPEVPPPYATCAVGDRVIWFNMGEVRETDISIARVSVTFSYADLWSVTLAVDFYRAGRDDDRYTVPYVVVKTGGRGFCWWFKDDDPMTYEVLFSR